MSEIVQELERRRNFTDTDVNLYVYGVASNNTRTFLSDLSFSASEQKSQTTKYKESIMTSIAGYDSIYCVLVFGSGNNSTIVIMNLQDFTLDYPCEL